VSTALAPIGAGTLLGEWTLQPLAVLVTVGLGGWYLRSVRRVHRSGRTWAKRRTAVFAFGMLLFVWTTCGGPQVYASSAFWMWTSQTLALLLIIPVVVMAGQPVDLGRMVNGERSWGLRLVRSRAGRALGNPLVGPALIPVLSAVLFFGPVPGWAIGSSAVGWVLQLAVGLAGAFVMLPLVSATDDRGSLAVGIAMAIGFFELLLDAVPGIVLRLQTHISSTFFDHRVAHPWSLAPLHDQQLGGGVLWCVAELLDVPFLLLVFRRWLKADAAEAARIDTVLDAERIARSGLDEQPDQAAPAGDTPVTGDADQPWWLSDRAMQDRLRRH
jgi:cytochrome c oxidase assembly factor CtaG